MSHHSHLFIDKHESFPSLIRRTYPHSPILYTNKPAILSYLKTLDIKLPKFHPRTNESFCDNLVLFDWRGQGLLFDLSKRCYKVVLSVIRLLLPENTCHSPPRKQLFLSEEDIFSVIMFNILIALMCTQFCLLVPLECSFEICPFDISRIP